MNNLYCLFLYEHLMAAPSKPATLESVSLVRGPLLVALLAGRFVEVWK